MAVKRHVIFERKLEKNPQLYDRVRELMRSHMRNKYVRPAVLRDSPSGR